MESASPDDTKVLLDKLITESANVRAVFRSSDSVDAYWSFSVCGRLMRVGDDLVLTPSDSDEPVDVLALKESVSLTSPCTFVQAMDFSGTPFGALTDNLDLGLSFLLPDGSRLALLSIGQTIS